MLRQILNDFTFCGKCFAKTFGTDIVLFFVMLTILFRHLELDFLSIDDFSLECPPL